MVLALRNESTAQSAKSVELTSTPIAASGPLQISRLEPNVLPIDYIDLEVGDEKTTAFHFFKATQKAFRKHGLPGDPWANAVQFKDEILKTKFTKQLPVKATYRFTLRDAVPDDLMIVIERPDLYQITCNGQPVTASKEWWLDRAFIKIPIATHARNGANDVTISTNDFGIYNEIEPAYLLGSFALEPAPKGFVVTAPKPIALGSWQEQGLPLYSHGVSYAQNFNVDDANSSYSVQLGKWHGSVARVLVNNKQVGIIGWAPWNCDITSALKQGENKVEVVVIGTLKNTLGPHHSGTKRGSAWPAMFQAGPDQGPPPGKNYDTIDYGLFEPFQLLKGSAH